MNQIRDYEVIDGFDVRRCELCGYETTRASVISRHFNNAHPGTYWRDATTNHAPAPGRRRTNE